MLGTSDVIKSKKDSTKKNNRENVANKQCSYLEGFIFAWYLQITAGGLLGFADLAECSVSNQSVVARRCTYIAAEQARLKRVAWRVTGELYSFEHESYCTHLSAHFDILSQNGRARHYRTPACEVVRIPTDRKPSASVMSPQVWTGQSAVATKS